MKILITGSSGRIGRGVYGALAGSHEVGGIDRSPFSTTRYVGDFADPKLLREAMSGADAVVHVASLHAPHVGMISEDAFYRVNVTGTQIIVRMAKALGVKRLVYTSTTALYGDAVLADGCTWIDEDTVPQPKTVYHRSKLEAEQYLEAEAQADFAIRVIRMSRCFPEPADVMALYRMHRGIDVRDVASAHAAALSNQGTPFEKYIVSGSTPFTRADCDMLARSPRDALALRCPELLAEFDRRSWQLPASIDRVYAPFSTEHSLGWKARYGPQEVLRQHEAGDIEVLPLGAGSGSRTQE